MRSKITFSTLFSRCLYSVFLCFFCLIALNAHADSASRRAAIFDRVDNTKDFGRYELDIYDRQGDIIISGEVSSQWAKDQLTKFAWEQKGVNKVDNNVIVSKSGVPVRSGPSEVALAIRRNLKSQPNLARYSIEIEEANGVISLSGEVFNEDDLKAVEKVVRATPGVQDIDNAIRVSSNTSDQELVDKVRVALVRNGQVNLDGLRISSSNGVVSFSGSQNSHQDIDRILSVALMVDGVRDVRSSVVSID